MVMRSSLFTLIALLANSVVVVYAQQQTVRINCGGPAFRDSEGKYWIADQHFTNGGTFTTSSAIYNTQNSKLLQSERYSGPNESVKYVVPVVNGVYDVRLQWSDNYETTAGARMFHVIIEGMMAVTNVDIFKEAGERRFYKIDKTFRVTALGSSLTIEFARVKQNSKISSIEIIPLSSNAPHADIRAIVNVVGEPAPMGISWADSYSVGNNCYCDKVTSYDHGIGTVPVKTQLGWMTVKQACELLGPGPGIKNRPIYNDVQCGNGPHNDEGDEQRCPGRVDVGPNGCGRIGLKWNFGDFVSDTGS